MASWPCTRALAGGWALVVPCVPDAWGRGLNVGAVLQAVLEAKWGRDLGGECVCYDGDFHLSPVSSVWGFSCCAERSNQNTSLFCSTNRAGVMQAGLLPQQLRSPHTWRGPSVLLEVPHIVFWAQNPPHTGSSKPNAEPGRHRLSPQPLPGAAHPVQPLSPCLTGELLQGELVPARHLGCSPTGKPGSKPISSPRMPGLFWDPLPSTTAAQR